MCCMYTEAMEMLLCTCAWPNTAGFYLAYARVSWFAYPGSGVVYCKRGLMIYVYYSQNKPSLNHPFTHFHHEIQCTYHQGSTSVWVWRQSVDAVSPLVGRLFSGWTVAARWIRDWKGFPLDARDCSRISPVAKDNYVFIIVRWNY